MKKNIETKRQNIIIGGAVAKKRSFKVSGRPASAKE